MTIPRTSPRLEPPPAGAERTGKPLVAPTSIPSPQAEQAASPLQPLARPAAIERFTNPLFPARRVAVVRRGGASPGEPRPVPIDGR